MHYQTNATSNIGYTIYDYIQSTMGSRLWLKEHRQLTKLSDNSKTVQGLIIENDATNDHSAYTIKYIFNPNPNKLYQLIDWKQK